VPPFYRQPSARPSGAPLRFAACHGFSPPLVAAVRPCNRSWHSPPALPLLRSVPTASFISCALLRFSTTHSFATTLCYAYGSLSRALPCPQGLLIEHGRHPAGPLRLRLRFCRAANTHRWLAPGIRHHRRQPTKSLALRSTDRGLPVRTSQSRPQPAVGSGAGGAASKNVCGFVTDTSFFRVWGLTALAVSLSVLRNSSFIP